MKMNLIKINNLFIFNDQFDYFSIPRILAYITFVLAIIFLLIILIRYLIKKHKDKE